MEAQVISVTTKGQIAIPIKIRKQLSINTGDKMVIFASDDAIVLKVLKLPKEEEFRKKLDEAERWAAEVGYKESDINDIIKSVRGKSKWE